MEKLRNGKWIKVVTNRQHSLKLASRKSVKGHFQVHSLSFQQEQECFVVCKFLFKTYFKQL